jgi:DNA mismatch endonuclease (patch repair protein)
MPDKAEGDPPRIPLTRSQQMSRIRGVNTKPELELGRALWAAGARYRKHARTPGGRPDFVFAARLVAVFVDGCQWHGCPEHYVRPRTRPEFWGPKLAQNVARDIRQTAALEAEGWSVVRVWEHELRRDAGRVATAVLATLGERSRRTNPSWRVTRVDVLDVKSDLERRYLVELRGRASPRIEERRRSTSKG